MDKQSQHTVSALPTGAAQSAPVRICLLGALRIITPDAADSQRFQTQKMAALLAYLALQPTRSHGREFLVELFWPDSDEEKGRRSLRVALTSLRRQLEPPGVPTNMVLIADRNTVRLNFPTSVRTDVADFEALLATDSEEQEVLDQALALYEGPLLPGFYDDWALRERERLVDLYRGLLLRRSRLAEQKEDRATALDYARRAVNLEEDREASGNDVVCEDAHIAVIRLLTQTGRPDDARRQYDTLTRRLNEFYDEAPSPIALLESGIVPARAVVPSTEPAEKVLTDFGGAFYTSSQREVEAYEYRNTVAGDWSGVPNLTGGFQLSDPRNGTPIGPFTSMSIRYSPTTASNFEAAVTLTDPTTGTPYTATGVQARLFSSYSGQLPENFSGKTKLDAGDFFVIGKGNLPANAGTLTIPNIPVVGSVSVPLANRAFLIEAGVGGFESDRIQLGTLFVKFEKSDPLYDLLPFAGLNPDATNGYVPIGNFLLSNKAPVATPTPSPTSTPTGPALPIGTVEFTNASGTNANTTTITNAEAAAFFRGKVLNASLFQSGSNDSSRVLSLQLGTVDDSSLAVGKTFAIAPTTTVATGKASVSYLDQGSGGNVRKFWLAQSGSVVVIARDSQTTTLHVVNATMKGSSTGSTETPTGTFTVNATGKF